MRRKPFLMGEAPAGRKSPVRRRTLRRKTLTKTRRGSRRFSLRKKRRTAGRRAVPVLPCKAGRRSPQSPGARICKGMSSPKSRKGTGSGVRTCAGQRRRPRRTGERWRFPGIRIRRSIPVPRRGPTRRSYTRFCRSCGSTAGEPARTIPSTWSGK